MSESAEGQSSFLEPTARQEHLKTRQEQRAKRRYVINGNMTFTGTVVSEDEKEPQRAARRGSARSQPGLADSKRAVPNIVLEFNHLGLSVKVNHRRARWTGGSLPTGRQIVETFNPCPSFQNVEILKDVSGVASPGQLLAIMGTSGSGKTTLLNLLAGRLDGHGERQTGKVLVNGRLSSVSLLREISAYVLQDDVMLSTLTPRETIFFSAAMRLPEAMPLQEKQLLTESILKQLGLLHVANNACGGTHTTRGVSGGERKRVAIGVELVTDPGVLFLDEPTSGLDSTTALSVTNTLKAMALQGRTIISTVHSPSSSMFALFDRLLLLSDGKVIYHGPASSAASYFTGLGYRVPSTMTTADFVVDILSNNKAANSLSSRKNSLGVLTDAKPSFPVMPPDYSDMSDVAGEWEERRNDLSRAGSSMKTQIKLVAQRTWKHDTRNRMNLLFRIFENIVLSLFIGYLFFDAGNNQRSIASRVGFLFFMMRNTTQCMQAFLVTLNAVLTFAQERALYIREKAVNTYTTSSYFLGKTLVELPTQCILPILFGGAGYWMIGLQASWAIFSRFCLALVMLTLSCHSIGLVLGAIVPHALLAIMLCPLFMVPFMLLSGFFLNFDHVPAVLIPLMEISPHKYAFSALMTTEFAGLELYCEGDETYLAPGPDGLPTYFCPMTRGEQVLEVFGMETTLDSYWANILHITAITFGFRLVAFLVLKYLKPIS